MKTRKINKTLRRVVVTLLVAVIAAATIFFVKTICSNIEYKMAISLAYDAPIYGSTEADLQVIEQQYADRSPGWLLIMSSIQLLLVLAISFAFLRWMYRPEDPAKKVKGGEVEDDLADCKKVVEFLELKNLISETWSES